jgi:hypothetical protein
LPGPHDIQVVIRLDAEGRKNLVEHPAVLGGHTDPRGIQFGKRSQLQQQGAQLDGFRAGSENEEDGATQLQPIVSQGPDLKH